MDAVQKLDFYITHLPIVNINFVYMNAYMTLMKTNAHVLTPQHYITKSFQSDFYLYLYETSFIKYIIQSASSNRYPITIHKMRLANASELDHPFAYHGDHLTFGVNSDESHGTFKVNTHRTAYIYNQGSKSTCDIYKKIPPTESCTFIYNPQNSDYDSFLKTRCFYNKRSVDEMYQTSADKKIIHHLVSVMNGSQVNVTLGGGIPSSISYKGIDFMSDEFHNFLRISLLEKPTHGHNFLLTMFFQPDYKNIVCFLDLDLDLGGGRVTMYIYSPTALKACFASLNAEKSTDEFNSFKMFNKSIERVYKTIDATLFDRKKTST